MRIRYDELSPPAGWSKDKIGNRLTLNYGRSQASIRADDGTVPIYGTGGLMEYGRESLCDGDSVLIGRKGTLDNPLYLDHPFWPVDTTYYTSNFSGSMRWFYYLIQTVGLSSLNEATGVPSLSRQTFYNVEVLFPPPEEQTAIAEVLATVDRAIAQSEALIAKQRRIKAGLLHDLLTRGIDAQGNLRHPSTHRFKPSPVGPVPEEWEVKSVDKIASFVGSGITPTGGSQVYGHEGIVFIRSQNVYNDGLVLDDVAYIDATINQRMHRTQVFSNDVLLNITGASIGRCCCVPSEFPAANVNQHVCIIRQSDVTIADAIFLSAYIASPFGQRQIKMLNAGGNREGLNYQEVRNILVPCPAIEEKEEFARLYTKMNETIQQEESTHAKLHRLKTGLMQDLLSGRVSVAGLVVGQP